MNPVRKENELRVVSPTDEGLNGGLQQVKDLLQNKKD